MRYSASFAFAALLAVTLAGKLATAKASPPPDGALFIRTAAGVAARAGLTPSVSLLKLGPALYARGPGCSLMIREATEGSAFAAAYSRRARSIGPVTYLYRGRASAEAPNLLALADHQLWRGLHRLGIATRRHPVAAVAASPGCAARKLDWSPLASLPG